MILLVLLVVLLVVVMKLLVGDVFVWSNCDLACYCFDVLVNVDIACYCDEIGCIAWSNVDCFVNFICCNIIVIATKSL